MRLTDFDFELPETSIARYPAERRDRSRLLVIDRSRGTLAHHTFSALPTLLDPGDLLVVNDTKVLSGRLEAKKKATGGRVELLLIEPDPETPLLWKAMAQGAKSLRVGLELQVDPSIDPLVVRGIEGAGFIQVELPEPAESLTARFGALPLPPYLRRDAEAQDEDRYQTIFARDDAQRSVAAPTAGLHFSDEVREAARARGIGIAPVTLHVGPGTFLPVRTDDVSEHVMHAERYTIGSETVARIEEARAAGRRIVAVGTTVTRVLETIGWPPTPRAGSTDIFIRPGFEFSVVDALVTNFHLPRSTLLMLVSAFADRDLVLTAYRTAVDEGYRFYSYGDATLVL